MKLSYLHVYTSQTWLLTLPEPYLRLQCDNGFIPAPITTP